MRQKVMAWMLVLLAFCLLPIHALGSPETGGPVYKLEWMDAWYDGSTTVLPKSVSPTNLSVSPNRNDITVQRLKITFSFSGEITATVPPNTVEIRVPASLFQNAQGNPAESSVVVPLPLNTSFNYRLDPATNEFVIYNFSAINEALVFTVEIDYKVRPSAVRLPSGPNETIQPYTKTFDAQVTIARPDTQPVVSHTNPVSLSYTTDSKLSSVSKYVTTVYPAWPASWGPAPADASQYFYVPWSISVTSSSINTQPFTIKLTDVPGALDGGQVVGWYLPSTGTGFANQADGWTNNLDEFHVAASTAQRVVTPYSGSTSYSFSLYMRYPRSNLVTDPVTGTRSYEVSNKTTADLIGDYGAKDTKVSSISKYLYKEVIWNPPTGVYSSQKSAYGNSPGMIDRLETAWLDGKTAALSPHPGASYTWTVTSNREDWKRTQATPGGPYGELSWTAYHQDNQFSIDTTTTTSTSYYPLLPGDYALTRLTLFQPSERIYGEPDALGNNTPIGQDPSKYGDVRVQVTTVANPGESDWITLGTSRLKPLLNTGWTYTPSGGAAVSVVNNGTHVIDLTAVVSQPVLGVRMLQTTKAAIAGQTYRLTMVLYPTRHLIDGLRPATARTGDIRSSVNLYNAAYTWATGGGITADSLRNMLSASINMSRQTYASSHSKSVSASTTDYAARQITLPFQLHAYNSSPFPLGTAKADAVAMDLLQQQTEGVFYDLLPPGTSVMLSSVEAYGYQGGAFLSAYRATHSLEIIDNFRNTGRSLLIIRMSLPDTVSNFYTYSSTTTTTLYTGFSARFTLVNTFDNLLDNPKSGRNYSAYESTVGRLGSGRPDLPPAANFTEAAAQIAFNDINSRLEPDALRFMHSFVDWSVNPPLATQLGFDKMVKTPEDQGYSKQTVVQGGGIYNYRLRLANYPDTSSRNIIFYDSMEDRAPLDAPEFWQGRLVGIDLSHPRLSWGLEPVVYYATREVNPKEVVEDRLEVNGQLNTALWQPLNLAPPYPADLKAIAVDMRFKPDGLPFVLPPEKALIVTLSMRAPADVTPFVNPDDYAWNSAFLGAQTERAGIISANAVVDVTPTKVSLRPVDLRLNKLSSPASGTTELPAVVYDGGSISYTLSLRNVNGAEAIPGIVLEDVIPGTLSINTAGILFRFGLAGYQPLTATARVRLVQEGQRLRFMIDQLAAGEQVEFIIPTTVLKAGTTGPIRHENTAVVTQAFGVAQEISSPTTYHETPVVAVPLEALKVFNAGGRVPRAGEFQLELTDNTTARNRVAGPFPNSGDAPYRFEIPDLLLSRVGFQRFYLREVIPNPPEANINYSRLEYYIVVNVSYNTATRVMSAVTTITLGGAAQKLPLSFTNTYQATGSFTPVIGKKLTNMPNPDSAYEGLFLAELTDEFNRVQTYPNIGGVFSFVRRDVTERDIGKTFTFTVRELPSGLDSVQDDARVITIKAQVVDLGNGQLDTVLTYWLGDTQLSGEDAKFNNTFLSTVYSAQKNWVDGDTTDNRPLPDPLPVVYLQLYRDGAGFGDAVRLADSGQGLPWTYTWDRLPLKKADGSGQDSVYTALEVVSPKDFQFVQSGNTITNIYRQGVFTAQKIWQGVDTLPGPDDYLVRLDLYQTVLGDTATPPFAKYIETVELNGQADPATSGSREISPWVYTWEGLDAAGPDPRPGRTGNVSFEYEIRENAVLENGLPAPFLVDATSSASTRVVNVYQLTSLTATKRWLNGPQDSRPAYTLTLLQDDQPYTGGPAGFNPVTLPGDTVSHTWADLPLYKDFAAGEKHTYSFRETKLDNYEPGYSDDGLILTNSYVRPVMDVVVAKEWQDGPLADRAVSDLLTLFFHADIPGGTEMEPRPVLETPEITQTASGQTYTWRGLPQTTMLGVPYTYTVREDGEENGKVTINGNVYAITRGTPAFSGGTLNLALTNAFEVPRGDIVALKRWQGGPEADREQLGITLYRQSSAMAQAEQVNQAPVFARDLFNLHSYTWQGLELSDKAGLPYTFTVREAGVADGVLTINNNRYTSSITNREITNTYIVPLRDVRATKTWEGGPAADHQAASLLLRRTTDGINFEPLEISPAVVPGAAAGTFEYTWPQLPAATAAGLPYTYAVEEFGAVDGRLVTNGNTYQVAIARENEQGIQVRNTYVPPRDTIYGSKLWQGGLESDHVAVELSLYRQTAAMAQPELVNAVPVIESEVHGLFVYAWADLPLKDFGGLDYTYTVQEDQSVDGVITTGGRRYGVTVSGRRVINTYLPELITLSAEKAWEGGPAADHTPAVLEVYRTAEGLQAPELVATLPYITGEGPYAYIWTGLPASTMGAQPYTYQIREAGQSDGRVLVNGNTYAVISDSLKPNAFINRYEPPLGDIAAEKLWQGGPAEDHTAVALVLHRQTSGMAAPETVLAEPVIATLGEGHFGYTWSGLLLKDSDGLDYAYTVSEEGAADNLLQVSGRSYTVSIVGRLVTNTYVLGKLTLTAGKAWEGGPAEDHTAVSLLVYRQTKAMAQPELVEQPPLITGEGPFNYTWADLPASTADGQPYAYTIREAGAEDGRVTVNTRVYEVLSDPLRPGVFVNRYLVPLGDIVAEKQWQSGPLEDHQAVELNLYRQSAAMAAPEAVAAQPDIQTLAAGHYRYTWTGLPLEDAGGLPYTYTVQEAGVQEGAITVNGRVYGVSMLNNLVINAYTAGTITLTSGKAWEGGPAADHMAVDLQVYRQTSRMAAPEPVDTRPVVTGSNPYTYTWADLPAGTADGLPYAYTIREAGEADGRVTINGNAYTVISDPAVAGGFINRYEQPLGDITAEKLWQGGPAADHQPTFLALFRQTESLPAPERVDIAPLITDAGAGLFRYTWAGLPLRDRDGLEYTYTVEEQGLVNGLLNISGRTYAASTVGRRVINTYLQDKVTLTATKAWEGGPEADHKAAVLLVYRQTPAMAQPELVPVTPVVTGSSPYAYTWADLPTSDAGGLPYTYTLHEDGAVDGRVTINGRHYEVLSDPLRPGAFVNRYLVPLGDIVAEKQWQGGLAADHTAVALALYRQSAAMTSPEAVAAQPVVETLAAGHFRYTWASLPLEDRAGLPYNYTVQEPGAVDGAVRVNDRVYGVSILSNLVINAYTGGKITLTSGKAWEGGPAADHTAVDLQVFRQTTAMAAPELVDQKPLITGTNPFTYTWADLPAGTAEGLPYAYTIREAGETDGRVTVNGNTYLVLSDPLVPAGFINRFEPKSGELTATKTWAGGPEADHGPVDLHLYRQSAAMAQPERVLKPPVVSLKAPYVYTWSGLELSGTDGQPYAFTVVEAGAEGGTLSINGHEYLLSQDGFDLTNTYQPPLGDITANKHWQGGPAEDHQPALLSLHRQTSAMDWLETVDAEPVITQTAPGEYLYTWRQLPLTDERGLPYTYTVQEPGAADGLIQVSGRAYAVSIINRLVINAYLEGTISLNATKAWEGGPIANHTAAALAVYRQTRSMPQPELVDTRPIITGTGPFVYTWENLPAGTADGLPYAYTVREVGEVDGRVRIGGHDYQVLPDPDSHLGFINRYLVPLGNILATKVWQGGPEADHTAVELLLYRQSAAMALPELQNVLPQISGTGPYHYTWADQPLTDGAGLPYTYTVRESGVSPQGELYVSGRTYHVTQLGNTLTNALVTPVPSATPEPGYETILVPLAARKTLQGGTLEAGQFTFVLRDATGRVLAEEGNKPDGTVTFPSRTFSRVVSNYLYTITEKAGTESGITYDPTVYTVRITTTAVDGKLRARVSVDRDGMPYDGDITFTNQVKAPPTGDPRMETIRALAALALALGSAAVLLGWAQRRRRDS